MSFGVFDGGKPASCEGFPKLKGYGWKSHIFDTFDQAKVYADNWLGDTYGPMPEGVTRYNYNGFDEIEIREL